MAKQLLDDVMLKRQMRRGLLVVLSATVALFIAWFSFTRTHWQFDRPEDVSSFRTYGTFKELKDAVAGGPEVSILLQDLRTQVPIRTLTDRELLALSDSDLKRRLGEIDIEELMKFPCAAFLAKDVQCVTAELLSIEAARKLDHLNAHLSMIETMEQTQKLRNDLAVRKQRAIDEAVTTRALLTSRFVSKRIASGGSNTLKFFSQTYIPYGVITVITLKDSTIVITNGKTLYQPTLIFDPE